MGFVPVFTTLKLAIEYFFKLILTDSESHGNVSAPKAGTSGKPQRPDYRNRNAAMVLLCRALRARRQATIYAVACP